MTQNPETALACLLSECLHVRQCVSMSHTERPFRDVPTATLDTVRREVEMVVTLLNNERIWRARDAISGIVDE
jgi:hypothetical protein